MSNLAELPPPTFTPGTVHWLNACIERSKSGVFSEVATLTPGLAGELLRRNTDNRGVRITKVEQLASDIRAGRWTFNGEPIILSNEGTLNDGQHRANAVIEANLSIPVLFVFGLDRDSRHTLDQGAARTAGDYLTMDAVPNATVQASIARQLIAYDNNQGQSLAGASFITNAEILKRVRDDSAIGKSAHFAVGHRKGAKMFAAPSLVGFCHYIFSELTPADADLYLTQVCNGEGIRAKDPAYTVRDRLLTIGRAGLETKAHVVVRGWNAFRQGRTLTIAKVLGNGLPALV